jgi:hypothetical protein
MAVRSAGQCTKTVCNAQCTVSNSKVSQQFTHIVEPYLMSMSVGGHFIMVLIMKASKVNWHFQPDCASDCLVDVRVSLHTANEVSVF